MPAISRRTISSLAVEFGLFARRFAVPGVLGLMAVVALVAALRLIPNRPPVSSPPGLDIDVLIGIREGSTVKAVGAGSTVKVDGVAATVLGGEKEYVLTFEISTQWSEPVPNGSERVARVRMTLPPGATTPDCREPDCISEYVRFGVHFVTLSLPLSAEGAGNGTVRVKADRLVFASNGVNLEGQLPTWTVSVEGPDTLQFIPQTPQVEFSYDIAGFLPLDWIGGPHPKIDPFLHATWSEDSAAARQPVLVSAVDRGAETADSHAVFFAGVFTGISGSAVVGTLQEVLHVHPKLPGRRRHTPPWPPWND